MQKRPGLKDIEAKNTVPGPGAYEVPRERPNSSSTRGTFGYGKRDDLYKYKPSCNPDKDRDYDVEAHTIEYRANKLREAAMTRNPVRPNTAAA